MKNAQHSLKVKLIKKPDWLNKFKKDYLKEDWHITLKQTLFGMMLAFVGVILLIWSGYKFYRRETSRTSQLSTDGHLEPLIKLHKEAIKRTTQSLNRNEQMSNQWTSRPTATVTESPTNNKSAKEQPLQLNL